MRHTLAGGGLREVVTYALVAPRQAELLRWPGDAGTVPDGEDPAAGGPITVTNPLSALHSVLRQQLVGSLLDVVAGNLRQSRDDIAVFEAGKGYGRVGDRAHEWWRVAFALTGEAEPPAWDRPARTYDIDDAKGLIEIVAEALGAPRPTFEPDTSGYPFHPGRAAIARAGDRLIGRVGECHPELLAAWDIRAPRGVVAELAIGGLSGGRLAPVRSRPVPRHPAVERDIAAVVAAERPAVEIETAIRDAAGPLLADLRLFDIYRGAPLAATEKSLAYRLTFQADRTLTEADVDAAFGAVVAALVAAGARIRT